MTARLTDAELIEGLVQALHTTATAMEAAVDRLTDAGIDDVHVTMPEGEAIPFRDVARAARELVCVYRIARS